jgi:hypothetical protein
VYFTSSDVTGVSFWNRAPSASETVYTVPSSLTEGRPSASTGRRFISVS